MNSRQKGQKIKNQYLQTKIYSICHEPIIEFAIELHTPSLALVIAQSTQI
jgi:hypothetical protein